MGTFRLSAEVVDDCSAPIRYYAALLRDLRNFDIWMQSVERIIPTETANDGAVIAGRMIQRNDYGREYPIEISRTGPVDATRQEIGVLVSGGTAFSPSVTAFLWVLEVTRPRTGTRITLSMESAGRKPWWVGTKSNTQQEIQNGLYRLIQQLDWSARVDFDEDELGPL